MSIARITETGMVTGFREVEDGFFIGTFEWQKKRNQSPMIEIIEGLAIPEIPGYIEMEMDFVIDNKNAPPMGEEICLTIDEDRYQVSWSKD